MRSQMNNSDTYIMEEEKKRLQKLHDSLPKGLPPIPAYLVSLVTNSKNLSELRHSDDKAKK